jgi:hypothetical protein
MGSTVVISFLGQERSVIYEICKDAGSREDAAQEDTVRVRHEMCSLLYVFAFS